jgi:hypothetical protein
MAGNGGIIGPLRVVCTPATKITTFTSSGTFQKRNCTATVPEIMVVAGGGGGGANKGGGGGAGGYRTSACVSMPNAALAVTVGGGSLYNDIYRRWFWRWFWKRSTC